jgi:hypothetical protein
MAYRAKRMKMKKRTSKKLFSKTASKVHRKNDIGHSRMPMRGGWRM